MSRKSKAAEFVDEAYNVSITGRHVLVTDAMKDYAIEKLSRIERFNDRIIDVNITMDVQKLEHRVDIVLKFNNIKIKSHAISNDMYVSIDQAVDKLERQILKFKDKLNDHQLKKIDVVEMNVNVLRPSEQEALDINSEIEEENRKRLLDKYTPHAIVNRETRPLKLLTDGEAIMKMELSGDQFMIYRGEENRRLKVIYRRNDGNFGVIEAEAGERL